MQTTLAAHFQPSRKTTLVAIVVVDSIVTIGGIGLGLLLPCALHVVLGCLG